MIGKLLLKDGSIWQGESFGAPISAAGEAVFATGMVGYPESLTDPSYRGQILVMTYPLIGNYGVPPSSTWESGKIQVAGLVVSTYNDTPSHFLSRRTLAKWLQAEKIPALEIKDTRALTLHLREKGCVLGILSMGNIPPQSPLILRGEQSEFPPSYNKRGVGGDIRFADPNLCNLVAEVSVKRLKIIGKGKKTIVVLDCGVKQNIIRELLKRNVKVIQAPWNFNPFKAKTKFHGLLVSNGPGDPKMCQATIVTVRQAIAKKIPIFGICLGNQILALAAGGDTAKMKFGHRGQNQPVSLIGTKRCYLTTQNHGFEVKKVPKGFRQWFINLNDGTNEGIIHHSKKFMSVQFHPESCPGPMDTSWLFDYFLEKI
jgi:carbamoyl-phosphate synthase small subunit